MELIKRARQWQRVYNGFTWISSGTTEAAEAVAMAATRSHNEVQEVTLHRQLATATATA